MNIRTTLGAAAFGLALLTGTSAIAATKVNLLYTAVAPYAGAYVAKDQGFFEKHGLDVDLTLAANGSVIVSAVVSGSAQIGAPSPSVFVQAVDNGVDIVGLASTNEFPDPSKSGIVAREGSGIKTAQDLIGKKVGVPGVGGLLDVIFRKWVIDNGVDPKKIVFVETIFPQMSDIIKAGQVDAVVAVDPFFSRIIDQKNGYFVADQTAALPKGTIGSVWTATRQWAAANPAAVDGFQKALAEAEAFIKDKANEAKVRDSIARYTKLPPQIVANSPIPNISSRLSVAQIDFWSEICKAQGLISKAVDAKKVIVEWKP